jgi:hypothetical protein
LGRLIHFLRRLIVAMTHTKDTHFTPSGGSAPKEDVYRWIKTDSIGSFMWIDKNDLQIDNRYQRPTDSARATTFSAKWSWIACGSLTVIRRAGRLFVVDGGHRLEGALKLSSVKELPCLVFDCANSEHKEASAFLQVNSSRKAVDAVTKYKAALFAGDPEAFALNKNLMDYGLSVVSTAGAPMQLGCVAALLIAIKQDGVQFLQDAFRVCALIGKSGPIRTEIFRSLSYINNHLDNGGITNHEFLARMAGMSGAVLSASIHRATILAGAGKPSVWAQGIMDALNDGKRKKLKLSL